MRAASGGLRLADFVDWADRSAAMSTQSTVIELASPAMDR
jgi:hypothetical protein